MSQYMYEDISIWDGIMRWASQTESKCISVLSVGAYRFSVLLLGALSDIHVFDILRQSCAPTFAAHPGTATCPASQADD